jgi:hypothetical protein
MAVSRRIHYLIRGWSFEEGPRRFSILNVQQEGVLTVTTISDSLFGKDIKRFLDRVTELFETLTINRGGDSAVVIMS